MSKEILILSPHLDDAVLSCCNHIRRWQSDGYHIKVLTLFSSYREGCISPEQNAIMKDNQISNLDQYEHLRKAEDKRAMAELALSFEYFDLLDAGFRHKNGQILYPDYASLTQKITQSHEKSLVNELLNKLQKIKHKGKVLIPLTVGSHIDHQITRLCGEIAFHKKDIAYYVDFPYARNPLKWRGQHILALFGRLFSIRLMDKRKREILGHYQSQVKYFFKKKPFYPEIILYR